MKIAIVNYRYFISGGPERYMFNIIDVLEKNGHQIFPFSIKHNNNEFSEYENYFVDPIGTGQEVYNYQYPKDLSTRITVIQRMLYSTEVKDKFKRFLKKIKPDIIYIMHFQNKLSCSIIDAAYEEKIPVVQRISDFAHICANSYMYREPVGVCNDCVDKNFLSAVSNRCISDSYLMSAVKALSLQIMKANNVRNKIDAFIFPSLFTLEKYVEAGFDRNKLHYVPTFFNQKQHLKEDDVCYEDYALFVGRLEKEKGIDLLIDAFITTGKPLKIIGFGEQEYEQKLRNKIENSPGNIEFLGKMSFSEIEPYLKNCLFTCVPSLWYENLPNTVIESYAFRKAVLANNIGSLPEFVSNSTGYMFDANSMTSLIDSICCAFDQKNETIAKGNRGYDLVVTGLSPRVHYEKVLELFDRLTRK